MEKSYHDGFAWIIVMYAGMCDCAYTHANLPTYPHAHIHNYTYMYIGTYCRIEYCIDVRRRIQCRVYTITLLAVCEHLIIVRFMAFLMSICDQEETSQFCWIDK